MKAYSKPPLVQLLLWLNALVVLCIVCCMLFGLLAGIWFPEALGIGVLTCAFGLMLIGMHIFIFRLEETMAHDGRKVVLLALGLCPGIVLTIVMFGPQS